MLDFFLISAVLRKGVVEILPKFIVKKSKDLMIRGGDFYAIWDEESGLWSMSEDTAVYLIDKALDEYAKEYKKSSENPVRILHMWDSSTGTIDSWHRYVQRQSRDNYHPLDASLTFANTDVSRDDYISKRLPYPLKDGPIPNYELMMDTLYDKEERHKLEWAIGAIISGDSKYIQKFIVLYGAPGTGKSTVLNIIQILFEGYYGVFDAKALGSGSNSFALEAFKSNPLVAIQHDGDLSRIEDNTRLNSVVSHEEMVVNEKFKSAYSSRINSFLFMGTNKPVKISDAKSGILRRLIDVTPSGRKLDSDTYYTVMDGIKFELGGIAWHCLEVYKSNPRVYEKYTPTGMMESSNDFYNFVLDIYDIIKKDNGISLKNAWTLYKNYCEESANSFKIPKYIFKEELKAYFDDYGIKSENGTTSRFYSGFRFDRFFSEEKPKSSIKLSSIIFEETASLFDKIAADYPAQYANKEGVPIVSWDRVTTTLKDLDTSKLHYVLVPQNHIVIDFDLKDEEGNKNYLKNLDAASKWPKTYAELSKSEAGIHLHYIYDGDVSELSRVFSDGIEIKVFAGKSALRRKLTKCSNSAIATISSGLPLVEVKKTFNEKEIKSEKSLRNQIGKNLRKEVHSSTKSSIDFIYKILEDAYNSELVYDISDMKGEVYRFASGSTNNSEYCINLVDKMRFASKKETEQIDTSSADLSKLVFFDVEVFSNLFIVCYKMRGKDHSVVKLINPSPEKVSELLHYHLVGFNNRKYDNHILYGRILGYGEAGLYDLSQRIINNEPGSFFGEAYDISYTDIYDFCAKKQSLKKWEIKLGIHHQELGLPWDKPVAEELWEKVAEYCSNDVIATEATFEANIGDFEARQMLAAIAHGTVNDTTNTLTTKFIFEGSRNPELIYTDFATGISSDGSFHENNKFEGYEWKQLDDGHYHNMYLGEDVGKGGYVYSEPGMYGRTVTYDVASMHPHSILALNMFGDYTKRFEEILKARIAIKHKDFETAKKMMNGALAPFLEDPSNAKSVAQALKIAINSVYGLTSASFRNPFKDPRNVNNIVALRGALFMLTLRHKVQEMGYTVISIKTDSIKIVNPSLELHNFVIDFGQKYGYTFEIEHCFNRICLVNKAVFIAKLDEDDPEDPGKWIAVGAQFQEPYVFKKLFTKEQINFNDYCQTKATNTAIYLDMNEGMEDVSGFEKDIKKLEELRRKGRIRDKDYEKAKIDLDEKIAKGHNYHFIGKVGSFVPVISGAGGGVLLREKDSKYYSVSGADGYRWLEAETVKELCMFDKIDMQYFYKLVNEAVDDISVHGNFDSFVD